jgi:hypothetical protein
MESLIRQPPSKHAGHVNFDKPCAGILIAVSFADIAADRDPAMAAVWQVLSSK